MPVDYHAMLHPELIFLDLAAESEAQLFEQVGKRLQKLGYVKESYAGP